MSSETILFKRARFTTRLPVNRRYTPAHYWLFEESSGVWRIGFTKFATRMLGDLVEYDFSVTAGTVVAVGQEIELAVDTSRLYFFDRETRDAI